MPADVVDFWHCPQADRIRIPGPGEEFAEPASIHILSVVHKTMHVKPKPAKAPRKPK